MKKPVLDVVLRWDTDRDIPVAMLPSLLMSDDPYSCTHVTRSGGHESRLIHVTMKGTKPAEPDQAPELCKLLKAIYGAELRFIARSTAKHQRQRERVVAGMQQRKAG